jgi:UDPglucose 6-dehydrogenase
MNKFSIGIIGNGFVGKATSHFSNSLVSLYIYDIDPSKCVPENTTMESIAQCDLVFICVPTPMSSDGSCSTKIVTSVINDLKRYGDCFIIVRSTVPIGYCGVEKVMFMPEFLTEANFESDFYSNPLWIVGVDDMSEIFQRKIQMLLDTAQAENKIVSNNVKFMTTKEAEAVKYFKNCFLAVKVCFCNEFFTLCQSHDIDYSTVADVATSDQRIGQSHTRVPGPDGLRGFGGTCFPKDIASLIHQFKILECPSPLLIAAQTRNNYYDRSEQDWKSLVGRAIEKEEE